MKLLLILVALVFLVTSSMNLVSSLLIIQPDNMQINLSVSTPQTYNFNITNTYPFQIQDISFTNTSQFTFPPITLAQNETKIINFSVNFLNSFVGTIPSLVSFNYIVDIPIQVQTFYINVTSNGYTPNFVILHQGDSVTWKNIDSLSHTITSSRFDQTLQPNQTFSYTFSNIENLNYQDLNLFWTGTIQSLNKSSPQKANNPLYNIIWNFNINALLPPTTLNLTLIDTNLTVSAQSSNQGLLQVINTGNQRADKITLSSNSAWITFSENSISLDQGAKKYISFTVSPLILNTSETNKNYDITITAKASNSDMQSGSLSVFVPFSQISSEISSNEGFLAFFTVYCQQNPNILFCNNTINQGSGNQTVILRDPQVPINVSASTVYDLFKRVQAMQDSNDRTNNELKDLTDKMGVSIPQLMSMFNQSITAENERVASQNSWNDFKYIIAIFIIISLGILICVIYYRRYQTKKRFLEGKP